MADYTKTTDFEAKDALPTGNAEKIIEGYDFEVEFDAIVSAIASKADINGETHTGTTAFANITVSGTITGTIDGGTY